MIHLAALSAVSAPIAAAAPAPTTAACRMATVPIEAGQVIDVDNTSPAACGAWRDQAGLRYDRRAGVVRARTALAAGAPLGRVLLPRRPQVLAGEAIVITARFGAVRVSRNATALQTAHYGAAFFARGEDGAVFVAPAIVETR